MRSPFLALLLIVNLLACPVRCISCEANVAMAEVCASPACSCCSDCDEVVISDAPSSHPEPCGDDCNCQDCICEGAVVEADFELPDTDGLVSWVQPMLLATHCVDGHNEFLTRHLLASPGQLLCGRDVRVAHQSWLI